MAKKTVTLNESDLATLLFKSLNRTLRDTYGTHKTNKILPLSLDEKWTTMGRTVATFTNMGIYFYDRCYVFAGIRSAKGGLWLEYYRDVTFNGKKLRKGYSSLIESPEELSEIMEWLTKEKDILCKNNTVWEYADEFHLWSFSIRDDMSRI